MKTLLLVVALAHGADTTTSLVAFQHGAREMNPLIVSTQPAPFVAQMAGSAALEVYLLKKLHPQHPKLATTLAWVSIGLRGSVAAHNLQVVQRLKRH